MEFVFQFVAQTDLRIAPGTYTKVNGGDAFHSSRLPVQTADEFTRITSAVYNTTSFCDLISVPWHRSIFHARLFNFSHSSYDPRLDQPILYNDEMGYCVYDTTGCEVAGTFPMNITSATFAIPAGGSAATYTFCINGTPMFRYKPTSPKSVAFVEFTQRSVVFDIPVVSPPWNVVFANHHVPPAPQQSDSGVQKCQHAGWFH
jgi:hypothetical protein